MIIRGISTQVIKILHKILKAFIILKKCTYSFKLFFFFMAFVGLWLKCLNWKEIQLWINFEKLKVASYKLQGQITSDASIIEIFIYL